MIRYCQLILAAFIGSAVGLFSGGGPAVDLWLSADEVSRILGTYHKLHKLHDFQKEQIYYNYLDGQGV